MKTVTSGAVTGVIVGVILSIVLYVTSRIRIVGMIYFKIKEDLQSYNWVSLLK